MNCENACSRDSSEGMEATRPSTVAPASVLKAYEPLSAFLSANGRGMYIRISHVQALASCAAVPRALEGMRHGSRTTCM